MLAPLRQSIRHPRCEIHSWTDGLFVTINALRDIRNHDRTVGMLNSWIASFWCFAVRKGELRHQFVNPQITYRKPRQACGLRTLAATRGLWPDGVAVVPTYTSSVRLYRHKEIQRMTSILSVHVLKNKISRDVSSLRPSYSFMCDRIRRKLERIFLWI